MKTESEKDTSEEQHELEEAVTHEGNSSEGVHHKETRRRITTKRERWSPSGRNEYNTDSCEEQEEEDYEQYEEKPNISRKKKRYNQRYSAVLFETDPLLKGWIKASSKGNFYAYCIPCGAHLKITSGKCDLKKHAEMKKHKANVQALHGGENCITAYVLGQDQPIATVKLPLPEKDSKSTKRKKPFQKYIHSFEEDPLLQGWVTASTKGEYYAHCIPCDVDVRVTAGKADLKRHAKNKKHKVAKAELDQKLLSSKPRQGEHCITTYMSGQDDLMAEEDLSMHPLHIEASMEELENLQKSPITHEINSSPQSQVKPRDREDSSLLSSRLHEAKLQIASFIARHGLSVDTSDHLIQLIKSICSHSSVVQNLECEGSDMVLLINNVLGKEGCEELMQVLRENKFSLIIDESTGRGFERHLSMVVRVLHNNTIFDAFLGLILMRDATAVSLYNDLVEFFRKNLIPYKNNMIGIAADGGNSVLGDCHSLLSLMKEDIPNLFVMKCISHSFTLCASCACLKLPLSLEDLARDIYSYFQFSTNYIELEEFEAFTSAKPHKLLHSAQARWLSVHAVVSKILVKYDALKSYFTNAVLVDELEAPERILQTLNIPVTKLYLMFLDFVLPIFDSLDRHMESESTQIHVLHNAVGLALKAIFECYLEDSYVKSTPLKDIKYTDKTNFKPMEEMYLGIKVQMEIVNSAVLQDRDLTDFRMNCLEFLIESVSQIYKRCPYGCHVLESLENLNPKVVMEKNIPSLINLISNFENLATPDIQVVDSEWRLLRNMLEGLPVSSSMRPEVFWDTVSKARQMDNFLMCPNLSGFMLKLLCLPNSTATTEKVFSTINKMKTRSKNISTKTLISVMYTNQVIWSKS